MALKFKYTYKYILYTNILIIPKMLVLINSLLKNRGHMLGSSSFCVNQLFKIPFLSQYWISFINLSVGSLKRSSLSQLVLVTPHCSRWSLVILYVSAFEFCSLSYFPPHEVLFCSSYFFLLDVLRFSKVHISGSLPGGRFSETLVYTSSSALHLSFHLCKRLGYFGFRLQGPCSTV